jgi:AcrR family transcriptional regulator
MDGMHQDGTVCVATVKRGRKFDQVVAGAREVFLADGFEGASVDEIARCAGVSKATLYSYFSDKRLLFMEVARNECGAQSDAAMRLTGQDDPPRLVLHRAGSHMARFFLSEFGQRVFRICVAEADRFPELGAHFYASGPGKIESSLGGYLRSAVERGDLAIPEADISLAAHQFAELCKADLFVKLVFGIKTRFTNAEIDRVITAAVEMFLCQYGTPKLCPAEA